MLEVKQIEEKLWGLYVNGQLLGTSKARCDAEYAKQILTKNVIDEFA
jgi:hypothetical protein